MKILNYIVLLLMLSSGSLFCEEPEIVKNKIVQNKAHIEQASKLFDINSNYLEAIIFVERNENFDWQDIVADKLLAFSGYNSSIGFCQIKINTAHQVELEFPDKGLNISKSIEVLVEKLENDSLNILYAAGYLRLIIDKWEQYGYDISMRPSILGTLYSTGLKDNKGNLRAPNSSPKANAFGLKVLQYLMNAN